jgi:hypothetical protein
MTPPAAAAPALAPRRAREPERRPRAKSVPSHRGRLSAPWPARRVSGPARGRGRGARGRQGAWALPALETLRQLPSRLLAERAARARPVRSLRRLLAGRVGIVLVAFSLIGIVTLQLGLLKLNGGIGRALEHEALLQRENAALSIENSEMAAGDRVEFGAAGIGMEYVPPGALKALSVHSGSDASRAASALRAPLSSAAPSGEALDGSSPEASSGPEAASSEPAGSSPAASTANEEAQGAGARATATPEAASSAGPPSTSATESAGAPESAPAGGSSEAAPAGGTASQAGPSG